MRRLALLFLSPVHVTSCTPFHSFLFSFLSPNMQICSTPPPRSINQDSLHFKDSTVSYVSTTTPKPFLPFKTQITSTTMLFHQISIFVHPQLAYHHLLALPSHWSSTGITHLAAYRGATRSTTCDRGIKLPFIGSSFAAVELPYSAAIFVYLVAILGFWVFGP